MQNSNRLLAEPGLKAQGLDREFYDSLGSSFLEEYPCPKESLLSRVKNDLLLITVIGVSIWFWGWVCYSIFKWFGLA